MRDRNVRTTVRTSEDGDRCANDCRYIELAPGIPLAKRCALFGVGLGRVPNPGAEVDRCVSCMRNEFLEKRGK